MNTPIRSTRRPSLSIRAARWLLLGGFACAAAQARADDGTPIDRAEPDAPAAEAAQPARFGMQLSAGAGLGQRDVWLPTSLGVRKLDTGLYPALDVLLAADGRIGERGALGVRFHYQTSVGIEATETPANGVEKRSTLRSNRVEAGLTPGLYFGGTANSVSLRFFTGWSVRGLRSVVDMSIPNYTLHGPVLRPELRIPFANGVLELLLAPEAQLIAGVTSAFQQAGSTAKAGFTYAGEVALNARISHTVVASLRFREAHATLSTPWSDNVSDVERYVTGGAVLCY